MVLMQQQHQPRVNGVLTLNAITQDSNANNTGTASWFMLKSDGGTARFVNAVDFQRK